MGGLRGLAVDAGHGVAVRARLRRQHLARAQLLDAVAELAVQVRRGGAAAGGQGGQQHGEGKGMLHGVLLLNVRAGRRCLRGRFLPWPW
ncbi:hypothetical protein D3C81_1195360 [compost metagenome]